MAGIWAIVEDQIVAAAIPWVIDADEIKVHCDNSSLGHSNGPLTVGVVVVSRWVAGTGKGAGGAI